MLSKQNEVYILFAVFQQILLNYTRKVYILVYGIREHKEACPDS